MKTWLINHPYATVTLLNMVLALVVGLLQKHLPKNPISQVSEWGAGCFAGGFAGTLSYSFGVLMFGIAVYVITYLLVAEIGGGGGGRKRLKRWRNKAVSLARSLIPTTPIPAPTPAR